MVDGQEGATWEYEYDQGGNILSKKKYVNGELDESKTFGYVHEGSTLDEEQERENKWRDLLKYVNGQRITYDEIGNPLDDGTWTYTWQNGRQLARMQSVDTDASFVYNENGLRVQKTVNGVVTNYTLHGKNVVHMTRGNDEFHFFYDAQNKPAVVVYNGTPYSYVKNLQGDIVAILNSAGTVVVKYVYDAWGRPISKTGSMAATIGTVQPFRYRGYVYDEETGLYYLQTRYYDPENVRFLNADIYVSTGRGLLDSNMFAYCRNNPVCRTDSSGTTEVANPDDTNHVNNDKSIAGGKMGKGGSGGIGSKNTKYNFKSKLALNDHYQKHNSEFGNAFSDPQAYVDTANYVIQNGEYVASQNGYVKFYGMNGRANYAFVGMSFDHMYITTFHLKHVSQIQFAVCK